MLLILLLAAAMLAITLMTVETNYRQSIRRDREVEMIHRGVQYARAIKKYFKKFGRYPASVDRLEDTNHIRFLRQRYKDPMTEDGKWKELHFGDVKFATAPAAGQTAGQMAAQQQQGAKPAPGAKPGGAGPVAPTRELREPEAETPRQQERLALCEMRLSALEAEIIEFSSGVEHARTEAVDAEKLQAFAMS